MNQEGQSLFARLAAVATMLLATVTLAAVALHGWRMNVLSVGSQHQAMLTVADLGATELTAAVDARPAGEPAEDALQQSFERWGWAVLQQPCTRAVALADTQGQVLRSMPADAHMAGMPLRPSAASGTAYLGEVDLFGRGGEKLWVAMRPVGNGGGAAPLGVLVLVCSKPSLTAAWASWSLVFGAPLGVIAALSFVVALRWLRRRVYEPLGRLARRGSEDLSAWMARLPVERADEVGHIARSTGDLLAELRELQSEVGHLRRTLDSRVAARTRQINNKLRDARREAWVDPLTNLANRRLLDERLEDLFEIQRDGGGELTAVMLDIDHFKTLNDAEGHPAGDDLLRFLGHLLRGSLRDTDLAIRYGGDEFLILLPDVTLVQATKLADRIVRLFAQKTSLCEARPQPTLSAGAASTNHSGARTGKELVELADIAMYQAKVDGKNGVHTMVRSTAPHADNSPAREACSA
jgi:diguanylate cyclase (GGDEF)-like protein